MLQVLVGKGKYTNPVVRRLYAQGFINFQEDPAVGFTFGATTPCTDWARVTQTDGQSLLPRV